MPPRFTRFMNYSAFISGTSLALLPTYSPDGTIVGDVVTVCRHMYSARAAPLRTACMRVINMTVIYTPYKPAEEIYEHKACRYCEHVTASPYCYYIRHN